MRVENVKHKVESERIERSFAACRAAVLPLDDDPISAKDGSIIV